MKLLDKKWKWAVAIILLLGVALLVFLVYISFFWTCCPEPPGEVLRAACQAEGGYFVETLEICRLPTSDAGKACKDSSECEGFCETNLSAGEISKVANEEQVEKTGACGQWKNFFSGCFYTVEDGATERLCAD